MSEHVMLDLETFGTGRDSIILSIGAVRFDPNKKGIIDSFEVHLDPAHAQKIGMAVDVSTVLWWMHADRDDARQELLKHRDTWLDVWAGLDAFRTWFGHESLPVWGNSAAFDNEMLKSAFERLNMAPPWKFWHDRCYRTVKNMAPGVDLERVGTYHSAVDDAVSQAMHLQKIVAHLGLEL